MKMSYAFLLAFLFVSSAFAEEDPNTLKKCVLLLQIDGHIKNVCDHAGKPYLLLEFFATRSQASIANIQKFKELENALSLVAHSRLVSLSGPVETKRYARSYDINTEISLDLLNIAKRGFGVHQVPTTFVLDANNNIVFSHVGPLNDQVANEILGLLVK